MRIPIIIVNFLIGCISIKSFGQSSTPNNLSPQLSSPVPTSPNTAAFAKFGNIPVGPSTGIPQITVPIYQYANKNSGLSLAVSLDYHAGGIKIDEMSSDIGIGWAMNAGGVVTRVKRGIPDEDFGGFLNTPYFTGDDGNRPTNDPSFKPFVRANSNENHDLESDIFSFNFNGRSGQFTYGRNGDMLIINDQRVKIEKEITDNYPSQGRSTITRFTITDESGTKYFFDATEQTNITTAAFHDPYVSSWYLTKIRSVSGTDSIMFIYDDAIIGPYLTSRTENQVTDLHPNSSHSEGMDDSWFVQNQLIYAKKIKAIALPNGVNLQFTYNTASRTDLPNDHLLSKILIQDISHQQGRGYVLNQDYSLAGRPTLLSVTPFYGITTPTLDKPYQFFYNSMQWPRLNNHQDHWGYPTSYVFLSGETELIPREIFQDGLGAGKYELPGINRDADSIGCLSGTMNKIIYPTGGWTTFELEANRADDGWLSQNFSIVVNDPPYITTGQGFSLYMSNGNPVYTDNYFTFNGEPDGSTAFTMTLSAASGSCNGSCILRFEIFPTAGSPQTALISRDITTPFNPTTVTTFSLPNLVKGAQYKIRFYYNSLSTNSYSASVQLQWSEKQAQTQHTVNYSHVQPYVGGLRAKRISDYDGISSTPATVREYEYLLQNGKSSGILTTYPRYTYTTHYEGMLAIEISHGAATYTNAPPSILLRQSSSVYDILYTNGSPVCYSRIVEYFKNNNKNNGKIERVFTTRSAGTTHDFPFVPPINLSWQYGLLKKEIVYNANNDTIKTTDNEYSYELLPGYSDTATVNNFTCYSIAPVMFHIPDDFTLSESPYSYRVSEYSPIWFLYNSYLPYAGRSDLLSSSITEKDPVTGQSINTITSYTYNNNFLPKIITTTNSKGQIITINNKYPLDYTITGIVTNNTAKGIQYLQTLHVINPVIEQYVQNSASGIVSSMFTSYKPTIPFPDVISKTETNQPLSNFLPATISASATTLDGHYKSLISFNSYDTYGNIIEQQKVNDTKEVYLWGYKGQYPVVKVVGSNYTTVKAFVNQGVLDNPASDAALRTELNKIRTGLASTSALVSTYTYSPLNGITSETDAKGYTTYYEYDGLGRLKLIKDQNGKILKQFDYQYQRQVTQ